MADVETYGLDKKKLILFGDDDMGTVVDEKFPHKGNRGIMMKPYLITPSPHLRKQYPELQEASTMKVKTPYGDAIWVEYPTYWVSDENPSRTNAIARVDCTFDGEDTPQTRRWKRYTEEIRRLEEENDTLLAGNMSQMDENRRLHGDIKVLVQNAVELAEIGAPPPKPQVESEEKHEH